GRLISLPSGVTVTQIAGMTNDGLALTSTGSVLTWGFNQDGELGNGTVTSFSATPVTVSLPSGVTATAVAGGGTAGMALASNGSVYSWGNGTLGQLGDGS